MVWLISSGSSGASRKSCAKQSPNAVCRRFNRSKPSRNGGIKKAGACRKKKQGELPVKKAKTRRRNKVVDEEVTATISLKEAVIVIVVAVGLLVAVGLPLKGALALVLGVGDAATEGEQRDTRDCMSGLRK